jgi:hypothetical protein
VRRPCAALRLLSIRRSTSTPRASLDSVLSDWPAAHDRMTSSSARCDAFPLLRTVVSISRITLARGGGSADTALTRHRAHGPHPHLDDRSSWWIYPRRRRFGHLMSPADARVRLEGRTERRCGARPREICSPNALDRSRTCRRVARRATSRNETREALPEMPSFAEAPSQERSLAGAACLFDLPRMPSLDDRDDVSDGLDPSTFPKESTFLARAFEEARTIRLKWGVATPSTISTS